MIAVIELMIVVCAIAWQVWVWNRADEGSDASEEPSPDAECAKEAPHEGGN